MDVEGVTGRGGNWTREMRHEKAGIGLVPRDGDETGGVGR